MSRGLGEEIAVLDGLADVPGYYDAGQVISPSAGGNYGGGSSWDSAIPLTPSNAGLAGLGLASADLVSYYDAGQVISPSAGADYSGGSSWDPALPLTPSNAGLAQADLDVLGKIGAPAETLQLQRLLRAAGVQLTPDGVWGAGSARAVATWAMKRYGKPTSMPEALMETNRTFVPFARGKMVFITKPKVLLEVLEEIKMKADRGEALAGIPGYYNAGQVISPSAGANYGGGSSWDPALPLTPSNAGLALADADLRNYYDAGQVISPSAGANYGGGSSWDSAIPLTPSNAGLAGLGLANADLVSYYDKIPGYYSQRGVISPSAGADYSGGSSWDPALPLTPSNAGLAGLGQTDPSDAVSDKAFKTKLYGNQAATFCKLCAQAKLQAMKKAGILALRSGNRAKAEVIGRKLVGMRSLRQNILRGGSPAQLAARRAGIALPTAIRQG
jgi:hypothetical protein